MYRLISVFIFFYFGSFCLSGQNTVGVLFNSENAFDGYTLYNPVLYQSCYLIDNCGRVINQWDTEFNPGLAAYLTHEGKLVRTGRAAMHGFVAAGSGGMLQIFNWDGSLAWEAAVTDENFGAHHDIAVTSYGSILLQRWEKKTTEDYIQAGKNPDRIPTNLWLPSVVEIVPTTMGEFDIIWEWHLFDHLVQNIDPTKDNYGFPWDNPRKVDINYNEITSSDWAHCNGLNLDEERDELVISSRNLDEIWVIDHSTSIEESASNTGGNQGLGGQLLYRFGNANTYLMNFDEEAQLFDGQHNAKLIRDSTSELLIQVFNNNNESSISSEIVEVKPMLDSLGRYALVDGRFQISELPFILESNNIFDFDSRIMSSVQRLPNNNLLINSGSTSNFYEITQQGDLAWHYNGPISFSGPVEQGEGSASGTFLIQKFAVDDPMFDTLDTSIKAEAIELNPNSNNCGLVSSTEIVDLNVDVFPTLFDQHIRLENTQGGQLDVECFDSLGNQKYANSIFGNLIIETDTWSPGIYFISIRKNITIETFKLIKTN